EVRRAAAIALRETRDPASLPPLFQAAAGDDDPLVRKLALEGMRATGDRRILPPAQKALGDRHPDVRQAALEILAQFPDPSHRPFLLGALTDPEEDLAERSARLLGETGDPRSVPELLGLLEDLRPQVRARAASVLGRLGDPSVIPALGKLVLEETGPPARRALGSLSLLRSHQALPWIVLGLANPDFMVHQESNRLLQEIPYSRIPDLLINSLEDLDPTVRLTAARALGWMKDRGPRPPLTAAGGKTPIRAYVRPLGRRYARSKAARGSRPAWRRPSSWVVCWLGAGFFETPAKDTVLWADRPSSLPPCLPRRLPDPFSAQVRLKRPRLYALDTKLLFLNPSVKKRRAPKPFRSHRPLSQ
ncbi:MAG TPA: HEAT repeat domain-containing protein, partial [bacterium]|nr:HEAT repeat domain-containing protein [bacterium]